MQKGQYVSAFKERPILPLIRACKGCKCEFAAGFYFEKKRAVWRAYSRCPACRRANSSKWFNANKGRAHASINAAAKRRKAEGRYGVGKWWAHGPSLRLYVEMKASGIDKAEARAAAIAHYNSSSRIEVGKKTPRRVGA